MHPICDPDIKCSGSSGTCPSQVTTTNTPCKAANTNNECDLPELCASGACPTADRVKANNVPCGPTPATDTCGVRATCDGVNQACPAISARPNNYKCRTASSICKADTLCDGSSTTCPNEPNASNSKECRASAGICKKNFEIFSFFFRCCFSLNFYLNKILSLFSSQRRCR